MSYHLIDTDPEPTDVRSLTYVPFLADGSCVAIPLEGGGLRLPSGDVEPGEHYLLDTTLRVPLLTAGFRMLRVQPFAVEPHTGGTGRHVYAWVEGEAPYRGRRPHLEVDLARDTAEEIAERFRKGGDPRAARVVADGASSYRGQDDASYYAATTRLLEPAYLRGTTPEEGSGVGGTPEDWRADREMIVDGIHRDGTFLDLECANGLLMESVQAWAAERGLAIEPYGVDLAPGLVELARRRLPRWADRIECGNAIDFVPADGRRFTFVHTLLECVPAARRGDLLAHVRDRLVEARGRMLVSQYATGAGPTARQYAERHGFVVGGESRGTVWIDAAG